MNRLPRITKSLERLFRAASALGQGHGRVAVDVLAAYVSDTLTAINNLEDGQTEALERAMAVRMRRRRGARSAGESHQ